MNLPLSHAAQRSALLLTAVGALFAGACASYGDTTSSTGERGRLEYQVDTDYFVDQDLVDIRLITGHPIHVDVQEVVDGDIDGEAIITHRVTDDEGAVVLNGDVGGQLDFTIQANRPGSYTIDTFVDDELEDRITLSFERPAALDIVAHIRQPGSTEFAPITQTTVMAEEGAQVVFIPIPLDAVGSRLLGDFSYRIDAPDGALVESLAISDMDEHAVGTDTDRLSYHLVQQGELEVRIIDDANDVEGALTFVVQERTEVDTPDPIDTTDEG